MSEFSAERVPWLVGRGRGNWPRDVIGSADVAHAQLTLWHLSVTYVACIESAIEKRLRLVIVDMLQQVAVQPMFVLLAAKISGFG